MSLYGNKFYIWHNNMCITYLLTLKKFEQFFAANGWEETKEPEQSDVIVIGACASFIPWFDLYAQKIKSISPLGKRLVVYGCLPTVNRKFFNRLTSDVELVIPTRRPERIEQVIENLQVRWNNLPEPSEFRREDNVEYVPDKRYVVIQYGCSEKCVYCPHKLGAGPERSRPRKDIIDQVRRDLAEGAKIIVLEGSNGGSWGLDLTPKRTYPELLRDVLGIADDFEIYIGNFAAKWVNRYREGLIHPRITDIKIPIQTTSSRLLKLVGRDPNVKQIGPILKRLKKANPQVVLRTEIIVGFPTETEQELRDTLEFVSEHFDKVSCFSYDFHPNTKIARMNLPFFDDLGIEEKIRYAREFFKKEPNAIARFDGGDVCLNMSGNESVKKCITHRILGCNAVSEKDSVLLGS